MPPTEPIHSGDDTPPNAPGNDHLQRESKAAEERANARAQADAKRQTALEEAAQMGLEFRDALLRPIEFGREHVDAIVYQPITGRHLEEFPVDRTRMRFGDIYRIASLCTGRPVDFFKRISGRDINRMVSVIFFLWEPGPPTGELP